MSKDFDPKFYIFAGCAIGCILTGGAAYFLYQYFHGSPTPEARPTSNVPTKTTNQRPGSFMPTGGELTLFKQDAQLNIIVNNTFVNPHLERPDFQHADFNIDNLPKEFKLQLNDFLNLRFKELERNFAESRKLEQEQTCQLIKSVDRIEKLLELSIPQNNKVANGLFTYMVKLRLEQCDIICQQNEMPEEERPQFLEGMQLDVVKEAMHVAQDLALTEAFQQLQALALQPLGGTDTQSSDFS